MRTRIVLGTLVLGVTAAAQVAVTNAAAPTEHGYISDTVTLATNVSQADSFGRDVDGDGDRENRLGQVLVGLANQVNFAGAQDAAIAAGDIVMLHSLRANSLANTKNATWQVWYGEPTPTPDFSGAGVFDLLTSQPHSAKIAATIKDHKVKTAAGTIPIRLDFGSGVFKLKMTKAKVFATCFRNGCSDGRIAGAVSAQQVDTKVIHQLALIIQALVDADCTGPPVDCEPGSSGDSLQSQFDLDNNLVITDDEVRENAIIKSILAPDLDLVHDEPPGEDPVNDALSFGFGFTTVHATLVRP
jgi:hypothetical protein